MLSNFRRPGGPNHSVIFIIPAKIVIFLLQWLIYFTYDGATDRRFSSRIVSTVSPPFISFVCILPSSVAVRVNLLSVILLLGILQGLILSAVLLFSGNKRQHKYFLAAFILVLAYDMFDTFCWTAALNASWADLLNTLFPYTALFTMGPSFYLYIRTTLQTETLSLKFLFRAYSPAMADLLVRLVIVTYAILYNHREIAGWGPNRADGLYHLVAEPLLPVLFCAYLAAAIQHFRHQVPDSYPDAEKQLVIRWTKTLLWVMCGVAAVWTVTIFGALLFRLQTSGHLVPLEAVLIMLIYWIGFKGYQNTRVIYIGAAPRTKNLTDKLTDEESANYTRLLFKAMDTDQLYLDPELSVTQLAEHLGLNAKLVSTVLNGPLHQGFNHFVNTYRVREVKVQLLRPENDHLTLLGIARNCGFSSQTTFQRVFREFTGVPPSEFRKNNAQIRI